MDSFSRDPWDSSNSVPHFTPLKSAEYLTDPAVINAYEQRCQPPGDQIRLISRISRNLHFGIWMRSVMWCCSLVFAVGISLMIVMRMDFRRQSLIYRQTPFVAEEESDGLDASAKH